MSDVGTAYCIDCGQSREVRSIAGSNLLEPPCPCKSALSKVTLNGKKLKPEPSYHEVFQSPNFRFFPEEDWVWGDAKLESFPITRDTKRVSFANIEPGDRLVMTLKTPNGEGDHAKALHERDKRIEELEEKYKTLQKRHSELHKWLSGELFAFKETNWEQTRMLKETRALLQREREQNQEEVIRLQAVYDLAEEQNVKLREERDMFSSQLSSVIKVNHELACGGSAVVEAKEYRPGAVVYVQSQYDLDD